ncbi:uncharacterized protein LOC100678334 [Nasonia vitripennis]|uniref:CUB domain-containing protein n=1 Tax=Nasonia vitripennis TaxID=7425 RepID=A0A7M7GLG3_NASVI|nr:uncharacterized protein LOC100678334 [Nasonia vitripennis]
MEVKIIQSQLWLSSLERTLSISCTHFALPSITMYSRLFCLILICLTFKENSLVSGKSIADDTNPSEKVIQIPIYDCEDVINNSTSTFKIKVELPRNHSKKCTWGIKAPEGHSVQISSFEVYNDSAPLRSAPIEDGIEVLVFDYDAVYVQAITSITRIFGDYLRIAVDYNHQRRTHRDANLALLFTIKYIDYSTNLE